MNEFGLILKRLRIVGELSQEELAKTIGVSKSSIAMYESGKRNPTTETMEAIADYFNVDMDYLFGKTDTPNRLRSYAENLYHSRANKHSTNNSDYKTLFESLGKLSNEDISFITDMVNRLIAK